MTTPIRWASLIIGLAGLGLMGCQDPADKLKSSDPAECIDGIRALSKRATDGDVILVAEMTSSTDAGVAAEAVRGLGAIRRHNAIEKLAEVVARERRADLRQEAVLQLGRLKDDAGLVVLRQALRTDPDPQVRAAAARTLGRLRALNDVPLLMELAESDGELMVQSSCVGAIESMIGMKFGYSAQASQAEREEALQRLRAVAMKAVATIQEEQRARDEHRPPRSLSEGKS